jgi:lipopolysaccharide export system protein LptC
MAIMALQTNIRQLPVPVRFSRLPTGSDRTKAFRDAKRHSALVGLLRIALPVLTLGIAALYFIPEKITVEVDGGEASIDAVEIADGGLKMINPRINGVHEKHGIYDIRAVDATQQIQNTELITLNAISAVLTSRQEEKTTLTAPSGVFHSKKEELTFTEGVVIGGDAGLSGKLKTATAFLESNKLISSDPVEFSFHSSTIKADSMTLFSSEKRVIFEGGVKVHLERVPAKGQK